MNCLWNCYCGFFVNNNNHIQNDMGNINGCYSKEHSEDRTRSSAQSHEEFVLIDSPNNSRSSQGVSVPAISRDSRTHSVVTISDSSPVGTGSILNPVPIAAPYLSQMPRLLESQLQNSMLISSTNQGTISVSLPGFSFNYSNECSFITETECCICFERYQDKMIMQMLPCNHIFHYNCLWKWYQIETICPMCRDGEKKGKR